ncbi:MULTISPECIES: conjugal transfer protein TrbL family protein [Bacillus cereus group]|uniref:conjugal transfer protein TrbL family protein n=1 Tax=Bacillus cereus group TaxID=86661 RepID=UPI0025A61440|nr:conjugal transfer protein TrbL family protein [Bacillus thuringiensis]MDM8365410.1 conjugal transfer protein TraL [Bacillus thuringiensis]
MWKRILVCLSFVVLISSVFSPFSSSVAYAKEGDLYEEHKQEFEKAPEIYREQIKKYDKEQKVFKCGKLEFMCNINGFFFQFGVGAMKFTEKQINHFILKPDDVLQNERYLKYQEGVSGLCKTLLIIFIMFHAVKIMSFRMLDAEDGSVVLNDKIVQIFVTCIVLYLYQDILRWVLKAQQFFVEGITEQLVDGDFINRIAIQTIFAGEFAFYIMFIMGILIFILVLQFLYRTALAGILFIMGPLAIVTKVNDNLNFYDFWIRLWLATFLTFGMQVLAVTLGFNFLLTPPIGFGNNENLFLGLAFFVLALTIPSILGQFGMSTNTTRTMMKFVRRR